MRRERREAGAIGGRVMYQGRIALMLDLLKSDGLLLFHEQKSETKRYVRPRRTVQCSCFSLRYPVLSLMGDRHELTGCTR